MERIVPCNGVIQLVIPGNDVRLSLREVIPKQTLVLELAKIRFTDVAASTAAGYVTVELPFLSPTGIVNSNENHCRLILPLDVEKQTTIYCPKIKLDMSGELSNSVHIRVYNAQNQLVQGLVSIQLVFAFQAVSG